MAKEKSRFPVLRASLLKELMNKSKLNQMTDPELKQVRTIYSLFATTCNGLESPPSLPPSLPLSLPHRRPVSSMSVEFSCTTTTSRVTLVISTSWCQSGCACCWLRSSRCRRSTRSSPPTVYWR